MMCVQLSRVAAVLGMLSMAACSSAESPTVESAGWVQTDLEQIYARSRVDGRGMTTELRAAHDGALLATMTVPSGGRASWTGGGAAHDIVVKTTRPALDVGEIGSATIVSALPENEREANDLLYRLHVSPPAAPAKSENAVKIQLVVQTCNGYEWDNMTCVVCNGIGSMCYTCVWDTSSGGIGWYTQCNG